jgi:hypothetical protein
MGARHAQSVWLLAYNLDDRGISVRLQAGKRCPLQQCIQTDTGIYLVAHPIQYIRGTIFLMGKVAKI